MRNVDAQNKFSNSRCCAATLKQSLEDDLAEVNKLQRAKLTNCFEELAYTEGAARRHQRRSGSHIQIPVAERPWFRTGSSVDSARA